MANTAADVVPPAGVDAEMGTATRAMESASLKESLKAPKASMPWPERGYKSKPDDAGQSFYDRLAQHRIPGPRSHYISSEYINSLGDRPCYCAKKEHVYPLLIAPLGEVRGQRRLLLQLTK